MLAALVIVPGLHGIVALLVNLLLIALFFVVLIWILGLFGIVIPPRILQIIGLIVVLLIVLQFFSGCTALTAYNSHVAAREDSLSGYAKSSAYGGEFTHRVEYR